MKLLFLLVILPMAMLVDLIRVARGKQTVDEEWHNDYADGNLNNGQGKKKNNLEIRLYNRS